VSQPEEVEVWAGVLEVVPPESLGDVDGPIKSHPNTIPDRHFGDARLGCRRAVRDTWRWSV
jgi:hypothetical protein